jgi:RNA polymerase sigma factor (sigma-70 family)
MDYNRLTDVLVATATKTLAGPNGADHTTEAEDLAQDVLIILMEKDLGEDDMFKLGVKIITDKSRDYLRQETRRREIEKEHGKSINRGLTGQSAESLAADPFDGIALEEALDRLADLSALLHATAQLHYIDGLEVSAIAALLQADENTIYQRLARARAAVINNKE